MKSLETEEMKIELKNEREGVLLTWTGKSLLTNPSTILDPFFQELLKELKGHKITLDVTKLLIMNSSTVPPILTFVRNMEEAKTPLSIVYDANIFWQLNSFRFLNIVVMDYKYVTISTI